MVTAKDLVSQDFVRVDVSETVAQLLGRLKSENETLVLLFDDDEYVGVVSKKWLLTSRIDSNTMKLSNLVNHRSKAKSSVFVPCLESKTSLQEVCRLIETADVRGLPLMENGKLVGVVKALDVLHHIEKEYARVKASALASKKELVVLKEGDEVGHAMSLMVKKGVDRAPVVDGKGVLAGLVSLTDIMTRVVVLPRGRSLHVPESTKSKNAPHTGFDVGEKDDVLRLPVKNIMVSAGGASVCSPSESLGKVIALMHEKYVSSFILVENNVPVSIITLKDILKDYAKARK